MNSHRSFRELYCAQRQIGTHDYERAILRESLHWPGRCLHPFRAFLPDSVFAADVNFVSGVGFLTSQKDFDLDATEFVFHPQNRGFLRRHLNVRVSVLRLRRLVGKTFAEAAATAPQSGPAAH